MLRFESASRRLADTAYTTNSSGQVLQCNLPKSGIYRWADISFHGSLSTTFASGSPAAPAESTIDSVISTILCTAGDRTIKSVKPHMIHMQEILASGQEGRRSSSAAASAVTNDLPTTDGGFVFGTTTQVSTVREELRIPFEMSLAKIGKEKTWLNLHKTTDNFLKFITSGFSGLDTTGAPVTYGGSGFTIETYLEEVLGANPKQDFFDYQQLVAPTSVAAGVSDQEFQLRTGNFLAGIALYVKNAASPSVAADLGLTTIKMGAGNNTSRYMDFNTEQGRMRREFDVNDKRASAKARTDGFVFINLMTAGRDLNTAFDARGLNELKLLLSSHASATGPLNVYVEQHIIVQPKAG